MRKRLPFVAGGLGAAALGIMIGLLTMCGDKKPGAQAKTVQDAAIAPPPVITNATPPVDAGSTSMSPNDVAGDLRLECMEFQVAFKWTELSACAERLAAYDSAEAQKFGATARAELLAEKELAAIEDAIEKKDKERAKKLLAEVPKSSVYRRDAEQTVVTGRAVKHAPAVPANCDADALKDKGMENVNMGQHAAALAQFEASLKCDDDGYVRSLAFMAACNAQNVSKSRQHYAKLTSEQRTKYQVMCERNHISLAQLAEKPDVSAPADCNADALKDKGMDNVNNGQHAAALAQFEASLRCKADTYVLALAFMAACNSQNAPKAKAYWPKLSAAQQTKYKVMCVRNKVDLP